MTHKRALIVDDSRSARVALQRMLEEHALDVETAESAEQALEYLSNHSPDVIFMDHMMPGMDGFEAVKAIKDNPLTATIPIMMYTSKQGEVYVGQARALGAVGVLPKQIEAVDVIRVLESLHLIPTETAATSQDDTHLETGDTSHQQTSLNDTDQGLHEMIQELFRQQRAILRRDFLDSYEEIAARAAIETKNPALPEPPDYAVDPLRPEAARSSFLTTAMITVLAVMTLAFAKLYWDMKDRWQSQSERLAEVIQQQSLVSDNATQAQLLFAQSRESSSSTSPQVLEAVQWAFNNSGEYAWDETPLDDTRRKTIEELVDKLQALGFSGQINISTHVGDFCMTQDTDGTEILAPPDLPASECRRLGFSPGEAIQLGSRQSDSFANFISNFSERTNAAITIRTSTTGNISPLVLYPPLTNTMTADEWNRIAAKNNRIVITLTEKETRAKIYER